MSKLYLLYARFVDATSGGRVYQAHWMCRLGIPPVPMWAVGWAFGLKDALDSEAAMKHYGRGVVHYDDEVVR